MSQDLGGFGREGPPLLTYDGYLKVTELLSLQKPRSSPPDRDELIFIVVHQVHELWFKLVLFELDLARAALLSGEARAAMRHVRRVVEIQRATLDAIHILETMSSADFLRFRDHLGPASGFQSVQFRELETLMGVARPALLKEVSAPGASLARLEKRFHEPTLEDAFYDLLRRRGHDVPARGGGLDEPERARRAVAALLAIYRGPGEHAELFDLAETLIAFDEGMLLWRYHHRAMVERMIGAKTGTGGSAGVGYLESTLRTRAFPDLWAVRTQLTPGA